MSENKETKPEISPVVKSEVTEQKKGTVERFFASISRTDDGQRMSDYILMDIIAPTIKTVIFDSVTAAINMMLYGNARGSGHNYPNRNIYPQQGQQAPYGGYGGPSRNYSNNRPGQQGPAYGAQNPQYGQIFNQQANPMPQNRNYVLQTRVDADAVVANMRDILARDGQVSYADYMMLMGVGSQYTDNNFGWRNLDSIIVNGVRDGYVIQLPPTEYL